MMCEDWSVDLTVLEREDIYHCLSANGDDCTSRQTEETDVARTKQFTTQIQFITIVFPKIDRNSMIR